MCVFVVCVCASVRACELAYVCVCVRACVCVYVYIYICKTHPADYIIAIDIMQSVDEKPVIN